MREIDRYYELVSQNRSKGRGKFKLSRWLNEKSNLSSDSFWFQSLSKAGLGKFSEIWFSGSIYFSLLMGVFSFLLFGVVSGFSVFIILTYVLLVRTIRFRAISRRVNFTNNIKSFLKDFRTNVDSNIGFEKSLEAAKNNCPEGVLKSEFTEILSKGYHFRDGFLDLSKRVSGKEIKILASGLYILSNSKEALSEGLDKLEDVLAPICKGVSQRAEARKSLYIVAAMVCVFLIIIDLLVYKNMAQAQQLISLEILIISQLFLLTICLDIADKSIGV